MNILGLDTATLSTVAAVLRADGEAFERRDDPAPGERPAHGTRLLALAEEALAASGLAWEQIDRIAVGIGPGGFTGLRIGIATARALAQSTGLPLAGVGSLEALALAAAAWRSAGPGALGDRLLDPAASTPEALADRVRRLAPTPLAAGDGAVRFREQLEAAGAVVAPDDAEAHLLRAVNVCRLGAKATPGDRDGLLPHYAREPDAVPRR